MLTFTVHQNKILPPEIFFTSKILFLSVFEYCFFVRQNTWKSHIFDFAYYVYPFNSIYS